MTAAISILELQLATLENNEPIHRAEGNMEQADLCKKNAEEIREGLETLRLSQHKWHIQLGPFTWKSKKIS